jgi:hypothetical protein
MLTKGVPNPNFKGFMAGSAQANWNVVQIVYGCGDLGEPMAIGSKRVTSIGLNLWIDTQINNQTRNVRGRHDLVL